MKARALLIEALVGIASAAVAAGSFCWMVKYTVLKEAMEIEQLERIADALEGISGHLSRLTSCIDSSGAFCIAGDVLVEVDKVK